MGMALIQPPFDECPTCHQQRRCDAEWQSLQCQRHAGHTGVHLSAMEGRKARRWGVVEVGCYDPDCRKGPDHEGAHNDGRGRSWVEIEDDETET